MFNCNRHNIFFRKGFICLFLSVILFSNAQNNTKDCALYKFKKSYECNLNDKVKVIQTRYSYVKPRLRDYEFNAFRDMDDNKFSTPYFEFYENGQVKASFLYFRVDTIFRSIDVKKSSLYEYDSDDLKIKSLRRLNYKYRNNVFDYSMLIKPNYYCFNYEADINQYTLTETNYKYTYDKKKRIKEELVYEPLHIDDTIPLKKTRDKDLFIRTVFIYNEKDQVVRQKILPGPIALNEENYVSEISYSFLNESITLKIPDLEVRYQYDQSGRIIQVALYSEEDLLCKEDYYYHQTKDYVEKAVHLRFTEDYFAEVKKSIRYFNENGDIIKSEFIPDYNNQRLNKFASTKYYNYEYDNHNNWIKCNMFLEGTKEGEPTLVAERKIEYFQ
jgi:hypothetical protein